MVASYTSYIFPSQTAHTKFTTEISSRRKHLYTFSFQFQHLGPKAAKVSLGSTILEKNPQSTETRLFGTNNKGQYVTQPKQRTTVMRYSPSTLPHMCCLFDAYLKWVPFNDLCDNFGIHPSNESQPAL